MSGDDGEMNGTPWANALGRLHTGPSERRPGLVPQAERFELGVDRLGALEVQHRRRRAVVGTGRVEVRRRAGDAHVAASLELDQPARRRRRIAGGEVVLDLRRRQDLDHSVVALDHLMLVARRRREHREDRAAHPTRAHPRDVEVAVRPAVGEERCGRRG